MEEGAQLPTVLVFFLGGEGGEGGSCVIPSLSQGCSYPLLLSSLVRVHFFLLLVFFFSGPWDAFLLILVPLRHIE